MQRILDSLNAEERAQMDAFLSEAEKNMLPKMEESACAMVLMSSKPDIKLCLEIGAAILFNKPIIAIVRRGDPVPMSMRTIAHKIIETDSDRLDENAKQQITAAMKELFETIR